MNIAMDAGLPIEGPPGHPEFDLAIAEDCAWFALHGEPDWPELQKTVEDYRRAKAAQAVSCGGCAPPVYVPKLSKEV